MSNRGYDVVVDVDQEGGDLSHTDLQPDPLQFHSSNFTDPAPSSAAHTKPLPQHTRSASQSSSSRHYLWSLSFYAQAFDVDTAEVGRRCLAAVYPRANFLDVLDGNPDLYGPFWIATTVVVILFLTGSISKWIGSERGGYAYDFRLLSGAAGLVYGYTAVIPVVLYLALRYLASSPGESSPASLLEHVALYGYANIIWIPVALISWSPLDILNYVFVGLGLAVSSVFLVRNLYPIVSTTPAQRAKVLLVLVVLMHVGLAIAIKVLFFAHKSPALRGGEQPGDESDSDGEKEGASMMF